MVFSYFSICVMHSSIYSMLGTLPNHHTSPRPCATLHKRLWIFVSPSANPQVEGITLAGRPHLLIQGFPLPSMFGGDMVPHPNHKLEVQSTTRSPFWTFSLLQWDVLPGTNQDNGVVWWYSRIAFLEICSARRVICLVKYVIIFTTIC